MADPATHPAAPRRLAAIPSLLLVAVAIWEIFATRCEATSVPGDDAWAEAAAYVRRQWRPGDLIVFAPGWVDPVGRLHLGDLIPVETAARMDAARYPRIWELSIRDAHAPDVAGRTAVDDRPGPVTVRRYDQPPVDVISDLRTLTPPAGRVDLVEVGFEPHRCVVVSVPPVRPYLTPILELLDRVPDVTRMQTVRGWAAVLPELLAAAQLPRGDRDGKWIATRMELGGTLAGAFGIADVFTRRDERRDVALRVEIDRRSVLDTSAPIDRWVPFAVATEPGSHEVRLRLRWEAEPGELPPAKQVCVAAEARR